jgi:phytanoyl-CoA dioxygenase PhyH
MPTEMKSACISPQDVTFYAEHGWIVSPLTIPASILDDARSGLEEHWAGHRDRRLPGARQHFADWMPGDGEGTRNNEYVSLQNLRIRKLALSPIVGEAAAYLTGSTPIRLFDDQMVFKPAGRDDSVVGWHVDGDYWKTCSSQQMLTAWIPLHDCPEELGPLVVLDGSHKWSHLLDRSDLSFHLQDMDLLARRVRQLGYEFSPVILNLQKGQFSFHHCRTIHGSYPNRSGRPRIAFAVHLQDAGNSYQPAYRGDGSPARLFNDRICRPTADGSPDYTDDSVFPSLWDRAIPERL